MPPLTIQFLHMFADQKRPLDEWHTQTLQDSLYLCIVKETLSIEHHLACTDAIDEVKRIVEEYDPPAKK